MSLNIKDEATHRRARELARATGESMTAAVDQAVRERLERVRGAKKGGLVERLLRIGRECASILAIALLTPWRRRRICRSCSRATTSATPI